MAKSSMRHSLKAFFFLLADERAISAAYSHRALPKVSGVSARHGQSSLGPLSLSKVGVVGLS